MPEPLPYSEVVKLEEFLWEKCMVRLPHALECAAWVYVIGPEDRALDDATAENLKPSSEVLGLEVDFWDEISRVKLYADDVRRYSQINDDCLALFDEFARTYVQKISDGYESTWIKKSAQIPDDKAAERPQWLQDWQAAPVKKNWQLPPADKKAPLPRTQVNRPLSEATTQVRLRRQTPSTESEFRG